MPTRPIHASHNEHSHNVPTKQIVGPQKVFCVNVGALLSRAFASDPAAFARYGEYLATNKLLYPVQFFNRYNVCGNGAQQDEQVGGDSKRLRLT